MDYICLKNIECNQGAVRRVRFNVDGLYCLSCGADKNIKLWNPHKGLLLKTYAGHGNEVLDACGSCDSSQIVSGSRDKSLIVWDVGTGKCLRRLRVHSSHVTCVKFNEEGNMAVSASHDNTAMLWDIRAHNYQPVQVLKDAKDSVSSLIVTDHEIITGSLDARIRSYDIRQGTVTEDFIGDGVTSLCLTGDGQCYIVSTTNSSVLLFDKATGQLLSEYSGHKTGEFSIECAIDQSDRWILSGSVEGRVYCWDLVEGTVMDQLMHEGGTQPSIVHSLHTHPTAKFLLTATQSRVHLWGVIPLDTDAML